ncbi:KTSC domain-containing protein [Flavobacterium sp.]|uniref:KTSC domain-containing protein n=1 Tax=Flavobacterium sp. TaxID=239 RepID=UPI0034458575
MASYYRCVVFFVLLTKQKQKNNIYRNVPLEVWQEFKNADSRGEFYNQNMKVRFILVLDK